MIHEVGNIELCELLDTEPKAQCKVCLSYWDVGIVYCTCGHFLRNGTEENKKYIKYTLDLFSIPNYYTKKGRPHGHRYGKKPGDHEYFTANSLKKKCKKKKFVPTPSDARKVLCWITCCGPSWKCFLIDNRSFGCDVWRLAIWFNVTLSNSLAGSHQNGRFCVWCNSTHP